MKTVLILLLLAGIAVLPAFAATVTYSIDKSSYESGDTITLKGKVISTDEPQLIVIQIVNPKDTDIVTADQFFPKSDGTFSKKYVADGPKWAQDGTYTLKIFYGEWSETKFQFKNSDMQPSEPKAAPAVPDEEDEPIREKIDIPYYDEKTKVPGFPDLAKPPNYYIGRYNNEPEYKSWFDKTFPGISINDIVGYPKTHVEGFPDPDISPQYYITRYKYEPEYKTWFDSQFPKKTIYQVLQVPPPIQIPPWIKQYAGWWASKQIDDSTFINGIEYMMQKRIIIIRNLPSSQDSGISNIPDWVRNNADWWAKGYITEDDFVNSLQYLIQQGIIKL